jgi:hypothetical protein
MKTDLYMKVALTIIAISLVVIAYKLIPGPDHQASHTITSEQAALAEGKFAHYVVTGNASEFTIFDPRTGDIWTYYQHDFAKDDPYFEASMHHTRLTEPGQPIPRITVTKGSSRTE